MRIFVIARVLLFFIFSLTAYCGSSNSYLSGTRATQFVTSGFFIKENSMKEVWKDIKGYEGIYSVSNLGRVKKLVNNLFLNSYRGKYLSVQLRKFKKSKKIRIHRIVAEAFLPNPLKKLDVNHKDGNKYNNKLDNLEWATRSENMKHAYNSGISTPLKGVQKCNAKLTEKDVLFIKRQSKSITAEILAKKFDVSTGTIYNVRCQRTWKHIK